jgi:hypothetical protein
MTKIKKRILKRAASIRPAEKDKSSNLKKALGLGAGLAMLALARRRRARRAGRALRNMQGVGPAHVKGDAAA